MKIANCKLLKNRNKKGFTLMEVALAVLVVAIGVLGLFALLSTGLDASTRAVSTTQAATFADATFNALRAKATEQARLNQWDSFWTAFSSGSEWLSVPIPIAWEGYGGADELKVIGNGQTHLLKFRNRQNWNRASSVFGIPTGVLRYELIISNDLDPNSTRKGKRATLLVWTGMGPTSGLNNADAIVFYTEFANVGTL